MRQKKITRWLCGLLVGMLCLCAAVLPAAADSSDTTSPSMIVPGWPTGDVNADGVVDMKDARLFFNYMSGQADEQDGYWERGDFDHDGTVDMRDVLKTYLLASGGTLDAA